MTAFNRHNALIIITVTIMVTLTGCTKQNWYQGAQSAQTANCMKQPLSEYENCNQQSEENYDSYQEKRKQLE